MSDIVPVNGRTAEYYKEVKVWTCWEKGDNVHGDSFKDILLLMLQNGEREMIAEFCMIAWGIWQARNRVIWQQRRQNEIDIAVLQNALHFRVERLQATFLKSKGISQNRVEFDLNSGGFEWVCKSDAAVFMGQERAGFGVVIMSTIGGFMEAISGWFEGITDASLVEALAAREAIKWVQQKEYKGGVVVLDAQQAVIAINNMNENHTEIGGVYEDARKCLMVELLPLKSENEDQTEEAWRVEEVIGHGLSLSAEKM
ncbi:hypothetical protein ACFE04_026311 [Oxalis oulophora]